MSERLVAKATVLTYIGARVVLDAAIAEAERIGVAVCVAVTDQAGHPLAFARMDGAPVLSGQIAQDKAYTVATFGLPTHEWWNVVSDEPALLHGIVKTDRLVIFGGGMPVTSGTDLVGAVGVSGGSSDQDRAIAEQAASACSTDPVTGYAP